MPCLVAGAATLALAGSASAVRVFYSDWNANGSASPAFLDGDVLADDTTGTVDDHAIYFSEGLFSGNEDVDAFQVLSATTILLSTTSQATLAGVTFQDEDVVLYDLSLGTASIFFDGSSVFTANEDVNAFHLMTDGTVLLSTTTNAVIGGFGFEDEDVVRYDPSNGQASLFFDGDAFFQQEEDVDAVFYDAVSGSLFLSTETTSRIAGTSFTDGDVIEYDSGGGFSEFFSIEAMPGGNDIDAFSLVPEPGSALLFGLGLSGLSWVGRRKA